MRNAPSSDGAFKSGGIARGRDSGLNSYPVLARNQLQPDVARSATATAAKIRPRPLLLRLLIKNSRFMFKDVRTRDPARIGPRPRGKARARLPLQGESARIAAAAAGASGHGTVPARPEPP